MYMVQNNERGKKDCTLRRKPLLFMALFSLSVICSLNLIDYLDSFQSVSGSKFYLQFTKEEWRMSN